MVVVRSADVRVVQPLAARDVAMSCRASRLCRAGSSDSLVLEGDDCVDARSWSRLERCTRL